MFDVCPLDDGMNLWSQKVNRPILCGLWFSTYYTSLSSLCNWSVCWCTLLTNIILLYTTCRMCMPGEYQSITMPHGIWWEGMFTLPYRRESLPGICFMWMLLCTSHPVKISRESDEAWEQEAGRDHLTHSSGVNLSVTTHSHPPVLTFHPLCFPNHIVKNIQRLCLPCPLRT